MGDHVRFGVIVKLFNLFQHLIDLESSTLEDQLFSVILFGFDLVVLASSSDFQHLDVRVGNFKSNNLARYGFSGNSCSRPTSFINCAVRIFTFDQTELVDALVPNHLSLLISFMVEGFDCRIFVFIEKVVIYCFDLPFKIVCIIR